MIANIKQSIISILLFLILFLIFFVSLFYFTGRIDILAGFFTPFLASKNTSTNNQLKNSASGNEVNNFIQPTEQSNNKNSIAPSQSNFLEMENQEKRVKQANSDLQMQLAEIKAANNSAMTSTSTAVDPEKQKKIEQIKNEAGQKLLDILK